MTEQEELKATINTIIGIEGDLDDAAVDPDIDVKPIAEDLRAARRNLENLLGLKQKDVEGGS